MLRLGSAMILATASLISAVGNDFVSTRPAANEINVGSSNDLFTKNEIGESGVRPANAEGVHCVSTIKKLLIESGE